MELRHLRYFIAIAEELHFARAAKRVHIEQSPLSRAIKELEADLGVELLERNTRRTRLTPAGKVFLDEARQALDAIEQAKAKVKSVARGHRSCLRVALSESLVEGRLVEAFSYYRFPDKPIRLFTLPSHAVINRLRDNLLDIGIVHSEQIYPGLTTELLWLDAMVAVVAVDYPLPARSQGFIHALLSQPIILAHPIYWQGANKYIMSIFDSLNLSPVIAEHAANHEDMLILIAANYGIGFALESHLSMFQRSDIRIFRLPDDLPRIPTCAVWRGTTPSPLVEQFMTVLRTKKEQ